MATSMTIPFIEAKRAFSQLICLNKIDATEIQCLNLTKYIKLNKIFRYI